MAKVRRIGRLVVVAALLSTSAAQARDDDDGPAGPTQKPQLRSAETNARAAIGADEIEGPTIFEGVAALNPIDAARDRLRERYGISLYGVYLGDPYGDVSGGARRGATYSGRLDLEVDVDTARLTGLTGGTLHANMFEIHGADVSSKFVGNFLSITDIAGLPTARLYELWYEQRFGDKLSVRAGQTGIDVEFITSDYAAQFINATFGWPGLPSVDLPEGGPAFPLATPAVRVKYQVNDDIALLAAVFDGEPAGPGDGDPQRRDQAGLNFRVTDPPLVIAELQGHYNRNAGAAFLPGTVKLGAFGHFGRFEDQRYGSGGLPLSDPATGGAGRPLSNNGGFYGILDQQVYRMSGDDPEKGVGVFARLIGAPGDRNLVDFYADGGITGLGVVPGRPDDLVGLAAAFANISHSVIGADEDRNAASGIPAPVHSFEAVIEATYRYQVLPGLAVEPTLQYVVHPGGNVANPYGDGLKPIPNATVLGMTTTVRF